MDQHVAVQRAEGGEHLSTETAMIDLGLATRITRVGAWLDFVVASQVRGELFQRCHVVAAEGTFEVSGSLTVIVACLGNR